MKILDFSEVMPEDYRIYFWGDLHIGNNATSYPAIAKFIRSVKNNKHNYVVLGGDLMETIASDDPRFDLKSHTGYQNMQSRFDSQRNYAVELLRPIATRILWVLRGNHEDRYINTHDYTEDILRMLGLDTKRQYGEYLCKANMGGFKVFDWHGYGVLNPSRAGDHMQIKTNDQIRLKRVLRNKQADCFLMCMHHIHRLIVHPPDNKLEIVDENGKEKSIYTTPKKIYLDDMKKAYRIHEDDRWYASCGTALKLYGDGFSTYGEKYGYDPTEIGYVKATVKKGRLINVDAIPFLE